MTDSRPPAPVRFHERMEGFVHPCATDRAAAPDATDYERGFRLGRADGVSLAIDLEVSIEDVAAFLDDPEHWAALRGRIEGPLLGGAVAVEGRVSLLAADAGDASARVMRYELSGTGAEGPLSLVGIKFVKDDPGFDIWRDTTRLHVDLRHGDARHAGILLVSVGAFAALLRSMLRRALAPGQPSRRRRLAAAARYNAFFAGALWRVYVTPQIAAWRRRRHLAATRQSPIAIGTPRGASDPGDLVTTHYVETDDGLTLTLLRVRRPAPGPAPGAVLLLHGLTSSSDMFIMPEHRNVVRYLLEHGFTDVWCADFRMSGRFVHNLRRQRDTMDDVALFDHPALIAAVRAAIGPERNLHVVAHCLGSLTFMMSLAAGRVAGIASVVCNSVALTPRVPWWSRVKLRVAPFLVETLLGRPYVTARWRDQPGLTRSELVARLVSWWHRECDEPACHMVSMMWGSGDPALFNHANLHAVTHQRIGDLFGGSSMTYYRHVRAMVRRGVACTLRREPRYRELPASYAAAAHALTTPVLFLCGDHNNVFTDSNPHCFERLHTYAPAAARSLFELRVVPGYGHQDIFMGRDSDRDVFPHIADFLRRRGG